MAAIINDHFGPLLTGQPVTATEKAWDLMHRATAPYGASGLASYAMSAVDLALWDLKGKLLRRPVYELLGGPQKERIFCYASNTDLSYGMEHSLQWFLELGFRAVKIFLTAGPEQNLAGLRETEDRVARARELVGDDVELAVDGWLNPNVEYAVRLGEMLRPYPKFNVRTGDAREFRVISCDCCRSTKDPALKSAQLAKVVPYSFETPLSAALRTITLSPRFSVPTLED